MRIQPPRLAGLLIVLARRSPPRSPARNTPRAATRWPDRVDSGVVVAFGASTPVTDFGPFFQAPQFRYLTGYLYADATLIMW